MSTKTTATPVSQETFLAHKANDASFIAMIRNYFQKADIILEQTLEKADVLIVNTSI